LSNAIVNTEQAEQWEKAGPSWLGRQDRVDREVNVHGLRGIDAAEPSPGERVLDIGCGPGTSSLQIAERLGPGGSVLGADISSTMVEGAVDRAKAAGASNVSFVVADAQVHKFDTPFDLVFSRFGVMFFGDPPAAFANIHAALKPSGRLAFVCWQSPMKNAWAATPRQAMSPFLPPSPPPDPNGPGPFSLADGDAVRKLVEGAGFSSVAVEASEAKINLGADVDAAAELTISLSPISDTAESDPLLAANALAAVREALAPHASPEGVLLDSATWIVTGQA
jgi:SAM-dependent methyltransferase